MFDSFWILRNRAVIAMHLSSSSFVLGLLRFNKFDPSKLLLVVEKYLCAYDFSLSKKEIHCHHH